MSFDTTTFWLFFVVALALWRLLPFASAKSATLFMSLVFYGWWSPSYILLIILSSLFDYYAGERIHVSRTPRTRTVWLIGSLVCNLGLLGVFKYGPFLMENASVFGDIFGVKGGEAITGWIIPVGISFYTFQSMSYSIDIYRRRLEPADSFRDYFLFVSFFPQLVAGPIIRAREFLPQIRKRRSLRAPVLHTGLYFIIWGMFMKIVVADNLATVVEKVFDITTIVDASPAQAWIGVICFSAQIFADFSGYSSIAIGLAYLMGLRFPKNFLYPYISAGFSEFWSRWHITLSQWLRDYLYISLGGNRKGKRRVYFNLMITMLLGGLWHGASWTFVAWGGVHGLALSVERLIVGKKKQHIHSFERDGRITLGRALGKIRAIAVVFIVVQIAWVFFRAESFKMAWIFLKKMFVCPFTESFAGGAIDAQYLLLLIPVAFLHLGQLAEEWFGIKKRPYQRAILAGIMLFVVVVVERPDSHAFIYFQF